MNCPGCGHVNRDGAKFCEECGARFHSRCVSCGTDLRPGAKFCDECGTAISGERAVEPAPDRDPLAYTPKHLAERIRAESAALESRGSANGERKTITALFADLKGSTALIEGLDPEDARAIIDPALQLMMDAVHRYDGYVAQALGDGIFALFGAPIAHEDHPQRALYAALRMQEAMRGSSGELRRRGRPPLQMRVGINTGEVVVRSIRKDDLHTDYVPVGHSTNLAARMEQLADPGSILVTDATYKLTEGYFEFTALGAAEIKGVGTPLNVYEVLGAGPLRTRLQVSARRGLTRFVGRHGEMEQLRQALEMAKAGRGQIVGVMGEPGLGKSRLFHEFKETLQSGGLVLEAFPVSHGKASAYLPLIELLKNYFEITPEDDERKRREKVNGKVLTLDRVLEATVPYLFALLGIEEAESSLQQMDAQIRRQRTWDALKQLFLRESLNQPILLIVEDLHWIDTETQGFLDTLAESIASAKILLLTNYRPEYRHEWGAKTFYTQLRLAPLGKAEAEELLTLLLGTDASLAALKPVILEKTEGTPFFMEEVVQTLAEEGALVGERGSYGLETTPTALHISPTVQGVLAARIDRLTREEKALLQQLAVIGRQFPASLVKQVVSQPDDELYRVLSSLQAKEYLYEQPAFPEVEYIFKHALTQEVAYGTVLQGQRKPLHERTAQAMEALYAGSLEDHYGELAHHYSQSDNTEKAIEYLELAGQRAVQRSANVEAIGQFTAALDLLQTLPEGRERKRRELTLQMALGAPLMNAKGYGAPDLELVFNRARALCHELDETPQLFGALAGLWIFHANGRAPLKAARELAEQLLRLAQQLDDSGLFVCAHVATGYTQLVQAEFPAGRTHFDQGIGLYEAARHRSLLSLWQLDMGVAAHALAAVNLWLLGYPEQAHQRSTAALTLAEELAYPYSLAWALALAALLHSLRRDMETAAAQAGGGVTRARDQGFTLPLAWGTILHSRTLAEQGHGERAINEACEGLDILRKVGSDALVPFFLAQLAELHGKAGQAEEGIAVLTEALELCDRRGDRSCEAELYRLRGELTLQSGSEGCEHEAEACFHNALEVAAVQSAKSWELRAAMSLARLWHQQGKSTEARVLLAPVYGGFTEGFDTQDLKDAKALMGELA